MPLWFLLDDSSAKVLSKRWIPQVISVNLRCFASAALLMWFMFPALPAESAPSLQEKLLKEPIADLAKSAPGFDFASYFKATGATDIIVGQPSAITGIAAF
jgi:hypothetical protein